MRCTLAAEALCTAVLAELRGRVGCSLIAGLTNLAGALPRCAVQPAALAGATCDSVRCAGYVIGIRKAAIMCYATAPC
jgi:hypothetical protein